MKKLLIIGIAALFGSGAMAMGPVDFGLRGGLNSVNFDFDHNNLGDSWLAFSKGRTGYHAGVWMRLDLGAVFVQPEFLYNWNRYDLRMWSDPALSMAKSKIKVQTFEVPVLVGMKLLFLRVNAGPVFNIMNQTKHSGGGAIDDAEVMKPSVSYTAGFGLDISKVSLDIRYNGMFEKAKQTVWIGDESYKQGTNFRGWTFGLGWRF